MTQEALTCARCGKSISPGQEKMGLPLITAGELVRMAVKSPAMLMGPPLPEVPYCAECRLLIARERTNEQLKVLLGMVVILALVFGLVYVLG